MVASPAPATRQRLALGLLCGLLVTSTAAGYRGHGAPRSVDSSTLKSGATNGAAAPPFSTREDGGSSRDAGRSARGAASAAPVAARKFGAHTGGRTLSGADAPAPASGAPALPLKTAGRYIVDQRGQRVKLRCVAWSGGQDIWMVPGGLHRQKLQTIASVIAQGGFNCVRLHFSVESVIRSASGTAAVPEKAVAANPDLKGKNPLEVMDAVVKALADAGLMAILDNHSSDAMWCCSVTDGNGLWYTDKWSEADWLRAWDVVAQRYASTPAVIGMGLRNEPRPAINGISMHMPLWGTGGPSLDVAVAYEKAAAVVLSRSRTKLVFASGYSAARDLTAARWRPLTLRTSWPDGPVVDGQLVYEAHEYHLFYGPLHHTLPYEPLQTGLDTLWGWVVQTNTAPLFLGEFGVLPHELQTGWWQGLLRYIRERDLDWCYWPLDGDQGPSRNIAAPDEYGLLNLNWDGYEHPALMEQLKQI